MSLLPGSKLGPYEIVGLIGSGGMGEVWKARDPRLGRTVAIKQVKEQHGDRFKQEAKSIAALNNPYICQIFDVGPDYLVLEYVEGKPLSCPLSERDAVTLGIQIATALEAAHRKGIIHRDLKPGNVMVTDEGSVKLLDFGLAKLYEQDAINSNVQTAEFPPTQAGAVLGTIAYMSPEQAQGQPADARSDIFSFGLVLYEMLSGRRAFSCDSNYSLMNAIVKGEPPPLQSSFVLTKIVSRCLAKQPLARYQTISEVKTALEQFFAASVSQPSAEPQPSIAVLPFVNMSGDKEQEYFSDGLAEEIINVLAHFPGLKVTARTSSFAFRGKEQDITKIAETLRVRTILEGSVRRAGNRIRVTAQLIDAADGYHLWSERYDRDMEDVFAVQDEIAAAIAGALKVKLASQSTAARQYTPNLQAYEAYLRARYYFGRMIPESIAQSREYAEQSITLDPGYAQPHVLLADCFLGLSAGWGLLPAREGMPAVREEARRALEIDPSLAEAHALLGIVSAIYDYDWKEAERQFRLAMVYDPVPPLVHSWYGYFYLFTIGRVQESINELERALEGDPLNIPARVTLAGCLLAAGRHEDGDKELRKVLETNNDFEVAYYLLGVSHARQGLLTEAMDFLEKSYSLSPWFMPGVGLLAGMLMHTGEARRAKELMQRAENNQASGAPLAHMLFHLECGEIDKAIDWLERAIEQRLPLIFSASCSLLFYIPGLRSNPRWPALRKKLNLPETAIL
jgi:TolB-like protein/predicted Ser/Thr protein kinase